VARYKLDECQGSTVNSSNSPLSSSNSPLPGTITIGASGTQTAVGNCSTASTAWGNGATGKYNSSLNFDGTDDYVNLGTASSLLPTGSPFSVSAWINRSSGSANYIVSQYRGVNGFILYDDGKAKVASSGNYTTTRTLNTTGSWNHLMMIFDGTTLKTYHNGILKDSISASYTKEATGELHIGDLDYTAGAETGLFVGQIDDVRVYNYALTGTQIKTLFNENSAIRFGPSSGNP
jgi:hypothetical protein